MQNNQHSQYQFKSPYNTIQATCLHQLNNLPQNQLSTSQYRILTNIEKTKIKIIKQK